MGGCELPLPFRRPRLRLLAAIPQNPRAFRRCGMSNTSCCRVHRQSRMPGRGRVNATPTTESRGASRAHVRLGALCPQKPTARPGRNGDSAKHRQTKLPSANTLLADLPRQTCFLLVRQNPKKKRPFFNNFPASVSAILVPNPSKKFG